MKIKNLQDLYVDQLRDLYSSERQLEKALPKMVKAASSDQLKKDLQDHLVVTQHQIERLDQIFQGLNVRPTGKKCQGMEGIITEGQEYLGSELDPDVRDAGIIAAAQRAEHYEISGYGTSRTFARQLGYNDAARMLEQTLKEEHVADDTLTSLAESRVNQQAK